MRLENLKKNYFGIKLSDQEVEESWQMLERKLKSTRGLSLPHLRFAAAFLSLLVLFVGGTVGFAQAADPGTPLYPVKILSDNVVAKVTGKPEIKVERRAEDLIEASEPEKIEEASKQYNEALDESEKEVKKSEKKKEQLNNALEKQEEKFKEEIRKNPKSEEKLEKSLEKTRNVKENLNKKQK